MKRPIGYVLAAGVALALTLAACGEGQAPAEPADDAAAAELAAEDAAIAEALFTETCLNLVGDGQICACVGERVEAVSGAQGLAYIGAAYGDTPALAEPFEAAMSQAARNVASEAFLDGQFDCVIAADPDYSAAPAPDPDAAALDGAGGDLAGESPLERAVAVCVETGAAPEPACRCRAEAVADAMGEDGLELSRAAQAGDEEALRALAAEHGQAWLEQGSDALQAARASCPA